MEIEKIHIVDRLQTSQVFKSDIEKILQIKLNMGHLQSIQTDSIKGFSERLKTLMPTLYSHTHCNSLPGYIFNMVDEGTTLAKVVAHIALELQILSGMQVKLIDTIPTNVKGLYYLEVGCLHEDTGTFAALAAVEIVEALIKDKLYFIRHDIDRLKCLYEQNKKIILKEKSVEKVINNSYYKVDNQPLKYA